MFLLCLLGSLVLDTAAVQNAVPNPPELLASANQAYRTLHSADAARLYRNYLSLYPSRVDVRVYLGGSLLNLNQLEEALQEAQHAIRLQPRYAKAYTLLGRIYTAKHSWELAQENFRKALQLDPQDTDTWYFSGKACYASSQFDAAVRSFQEALNLGAQQSRVHGNLALSYDALGEYEKADIEYRRAVTLSQGEYRPYLDYGVFLFRQRRTNESVSVLQRAFQLQPNVEDVRFELARALFHAGQFAGGELHGHTLL